MLRGSWELLYPLSTRSSNVMEVAKERDVVLIKGVDAREVVSLV